MKSYDNNRWFLTLLAFALMVWRSVRPSVRHQLSPLNDFFSRTTRPILTKLGRNDAWEKGIQICSNKGAGPFWVK